MNIIKFLKILARNIKFIILIPLLVGVIVYFLTKNLPDIYQTETTLFTGITSNSGLDVGVVKIDNNATKNAYDNVISLFKSDLLFEDVALHLLTQHLMLSKPDKNIISEKAFISLSENIPPEVKKLIVKNNFEKSLSNLRTNIKSDKKNFIYTLLNYSNPYYSIGAISRLEVKRLSNSDLIQISFESSDPAIAYNTIKFASEIFIKKYSLLKVGQSNDAVAYFEKRLAEMAIKLKEAEDKLLDFNVNNTIINYYEQTEQVTTQQEKIELKLQDTKMEFESATAVLNKIEKEVETRFKINLKNKEVFSIRKELVECNLRLANYEFEQNNKISLSDLRAEKSKLEKLLEFKIDSITVFDTKSQGMEAQKILSEWLDAVKAVESSNANFKSMKERIVEFMKQFKQYAPLGATIKRIEREIDINEREYLYILSQLGLAKQKQQNTDMVSDMKIIDEAKLPLYPLPSKKKLYVIVGVLLSLILFIVTLFIIELLDKRIKTPSKLLSLTNLVVLGAFCEKSNNKKAINIDKITEKAAFFIFEKFITLSSDKHKQFLSIDTNNPYVIQLTTNWDHSILKNLNEYIVNEILRNESTVTILDFNKSNIENTTLIDNEIKIEGVDYLTLQNGIRNFKHFEEIVSSESIKSDFLIILQNPTSEGIDNIKIAKTADLNLIAFDANTTWIEADDHYLEKIKQISEKNLFAILMNAYPDDIEEMYGELPKKRSFFRIFVKRTIKNIS